MAIIRTTNTTTGTTTPMIIIVVLERSVSSVVDTLLGLMEVTDLVGDVAIVLIAMRSCDVAIILIAMRSCDVVIVAIVLAVSLAFTLVSRLVRFVVFTGPIVIYKNISA